MNMRLKKLILILEITLFSLFVFIHHSEAQQGGVVLIGTVADKNGDPLHGVLVVIKGTSKGTETDLDGKFSIAAPSGNYVLQFSYEGYDTKEITASKNTGLVVTLVESVKNRDDEVTVAYGTQKKEAVTAAISTIQTTELQQSSAANLSTALAGRLSGFADQQSFENVVANLYLRGRGTFGGADPLILIDGIPRSDIGSLDPNEIASISILKDASSTAVFGIRGANGVILITTRRGSQGKIELSMTVDYGLQNLMITADRVHSWEYAELRNQAFRNDGLPETFTPYMIDKYKSGTDRVFYPDRNPVHDYMRKWTPQTRVNLNLNGGSEVFKCFLNVGYIGQGGLFETEPKSFLGYDPQYNMDRYNFRVNLDFNITKSLKLSVNLSNSLEKINSPYTDDVLAESMDGMIKNMIFNFWMTPPTDPGPLTARGYHTVDGEEVPINQMLTQAVWEHSPYGELNRRGYRQESKTLFNSSAIIDWDLSAITKGLSAKFQLAYDTKGRNIRQGARSYDRYSFKIATSGDEQSYYAINLSNQDEAIRINKWIYSNYYLNMQYAMNYGRQFGKHNIAAMVLFQRDNWQNYNADLPYNIMGLVGRVNYGYDNRYLAEMNLGYNGTEQFAPDNRFGFFPSISLGWVVSNEKFLKIIRYSPN